MPRPAGQRLEEIDADRAAEIPRSIWRQAVEQIRQELEDSVKAACSVPNPPPFKNSSKDGEYPRARTFLFHDGLRVVYSEENNSLRLYSKMPYGKYLQGPPLSSGLRDHTTRPFGTKILAEQDWVGRIAKLARAMTK